MGPSLTTGSGGMIGPESDQGKRRGQGATPAAFYLGLCRLRGILSPPASATVILQAEPFFSAATKIRIGDRTRCRDGRCRRAVLSCSSEGAASIRKSALKSRIDSRWLCDYDLQAKPFSVAAKKISIGRGPHCRYDRSRRNHLLDCFQLLVLILVVLVYLCLKP